MPAKQDYAQGLPGAKLLEILELRTRELAEGKQVSTPGGRKTSAARLFHQSQPDHWRNHAANHSSRQVQAMRNLRGYLSDLGL
jgi:hypothetical protein